MAKALQCPSCGATTRLDSVPEGGAIRCGSCGQSMKVPPGVGGRGSASSGAGGAAPPPRRSGGRASAATPAGAGGGTAVIAQGAAPGPAVARPTASPVASPPMRPSGSGADGGGRDALPLALRILAWVLALPLGLAIVGIPARQAGYLSSQKLLDVIVKHDLGRFLPIVVVIALWALVSAVLVTVFVEGGRRLMLRRRRRKAER